MFPMPSQLNTCGRRNRFAATVVGMIGLAWGILGIERGRMSAGEEVSAPTKEAAIAQVERLGGEVRIDGEKPDQPVWAVDFSGKSIGNQDLQVLVGFPALEVLNLADTPINDEGLKFASGCKELQELNLSGTKITDAGLAHLLRLTKLKTLDLNQTAVTDDGLQQLAVLKRLSRPNVFETKVTEAGLQRLETAIRAAPVAPEAAAHDPSRQTQASATGLHALGRSALIAARGDVVAKREQRRAACARSVFPLGFGRQPVLPTRPERKPADVFLRVVPGNSLDRQHACSIVVVARVFAHHRAPFGLGDFVLAHRVGGDRNAALRHLIGLGREADARLGLPAHDENAGGHHHHLRTLGAVTELTPRSGLGRGSVDSQTEQQGKQACVQNTGHGNTEAVKFTMICRTRRGPRDG